MVISVLVLTRNEAKNILRCLESVRWSDDVVVLDDDSSDETAEIAAAAGARVIKHSAGNELEQRTYSVRGLEFKHSWVYNPDADEVPSADLIEEMKRVVKDEGRPEVAYRVRFRTILMGRWIRHASLYPTWVVRLFMPEKLSFKRLTNLQYVVDGVEGRLLGHFDHYTFDNGLEAWSHKHNHYSTLEAEEAMNHLREGGVDWAGLAAVGDPARRRRALKELSFRLPCRPTLRFLYMYVLRQGFLDGAPGLLYCRMLAAYERMIVWKMREIRRRQKCSVIAPGPTNRSRA